MGPSRFHCAVAGTTEEVVGQLLLQQQKYEALVVELKENLVAAEDRAEQLQQRLRKSGQRPAARAEEEASPVRTKQFTVTPKDVKLPEFWGSTDPEGYVIDPGSAH